MAFDPDAYLKEKPFDPNEYAGIKPPDVPADETAAAISAAEAAAMRTRRSVKSPNKTPSPELTEAEKMTQAAALGGLNSATFGMANRGLAVADYLSGGSPSYSDSLNKVVGRDEKLSDQYPWSHGIGSVAGGIGTGVGLARGGFTLAREGVNWGARTGAGILEGLGYGAVGGAGQTYTGNPEDYLRNGLIGGGVGGVVGGAAPTVISVGKGAIDKVGGMLRPIWASADDTAIENVAGVVRKSGKTTEQIRNDVTNAYAANQPTYSAVDAIGDPAQRKLATIAKQPGTGRTETKDFLETRETGAPTRRAGEVNKALGVKGTAEQATQDLIDTAQQQSAPLYKSAMEHGPVWNDTIAEGLAHPVMKEGIRRGVHLQSVDNAMTGKPFNPTDAAITGFNEAGDPIIKGVPNMRTLQTAKEGLDQMIEEQIDKVTGRMSKYGAALVGFKNRLLAQIDELNPDYKEARKIYAGPMAVKGAVKEGQGATSPAQRYADTVDTFRGYGSPSEQQGFRIGYADRVNAQLEGGTVPKILSPRSEKGVNEFGELSLYQGPRKPGTPDQFRQFMNREDQMARTTKAATGGSSTAENIADFADAPGTFRDIASIAGNALRGRWGSALSGAVDKAGNVLHGEYEAQRAAIAKLLLSNKTTPELFDDMLRRINEIEARRAASQFSADAAARGGAGAGSVMWQQNRQPTRITVNPRPGYYQGQ